MTTEAIFDPHAAREKMHALRAEVKAMTKDRPQVAWTALVARLKAGLGRDRAGDEFTAQEEAWNAAHPEVIAKERELEDLRKALEPYQAQFKQEHDRAEEAREAKELHISALRVLDDVPRVRSVIESEKIERTEAVDAVDDFTAKPSLWCLLLLGGVGAGKSTAAGKAAVDARRSRRASVQWLRPAIESLNPAFGDEARGKVNSWRGCGLLVVDDIGTEMMTPTWQQCLDDVFDHRYQHSLRTIITSNLGGEEFKKRYGERIADRIREDGMVVTLANKSLRRKAQ
jgi:DNA replication protein DnaC